MIGFQTQKAFFARWRHLVGDMPQAEAEAFRHRLIWIHTGERGTSLHDLTPTEATRLIAAIQALAQPDSTEDSF